jgi:uncharacterized membrane protein YbhN (UPF0104 family)
MTPSPRKGPRQRLGALLSTGLGAGLFALALWVLHRWVRHLTLDELGAELDHIGAAQIGAAILFTLLSFVALAGYEHYATRYIHRPLPLWRVGLYSFVTQSITHATGFSIVIGPSLRYKLYIPHQLSFLDVAKLQLFFSTTFALGTVTLIGGVLLLEPSVLAAATSITPGIWRLLGLLLLLALAGLLVWGSFFHRPMRLFGQLIVLPTAGITFIQILLGLADLSAVAAALHVLLPAGLGLGFAQVLGIYGAALAVGLVSHVPGSLGVFESTVILLVGPDDALALPLLASLVMFRGIYYMLPLTMGAVVFGAIEVWRWLWPGTLSAPGSQA